MVKCTNCGFLATRNVDSRELVEMEGKFRETGECPQRQDFSPNYNLYEIPLCFKRAYDIRNEISVAEPKGQPWSMAITSVIYKDRDCQSFIDWKQGFTPKEHQEMQDRQWKIEYQSKREDTDREWRAEQRKLDLEWREKQSLDDKIWRVAQESKASSRHRWDLIITGGVATLLICGATIVAAFISRMK